MDLLRLYKFYAWMDFMLLLRDLKISLLYMITDLLLSAASVSSIFLLSQRFGGIGGMDRMEVLFMLGFITLSRGIILATGANNIDHISRRIGRGQVDHMLAQPVPLWAQCMTEGFSPVTGGPMVLCGIAVVAVAASQIGIVATPGWILRLIGLLILTVCLHFALMYLFSASAFWFPNACEEISSEVNASMDTLRNYPLSGMPRAMQRVLTTALPAGLMGWYPAMLLLGIDEARFSLLLPIAVTATITLLAILAMWKGWKHYGTTGSNRYKNYGFRR